MGRADYLGWLFSYLPLKPLEPATLADGVTSTICSMIGSSIQFIPWPQPSWRLGWVGRSVFALSAAAVFFLHIKNVLGFC